MPAQTSSAFKQIINCHASLIEDLLNDGYKFFMTARFQSDLSVRRFGQYRQVNGGRFLVSLKDVLCSEHIKFKSLVKEGIDICNSDVNKTNDQKIILNKLQCSTLNNVSLTEDSREVTFYIAGYIAKKISKRFGKCCHKQMIRVNKYDYSYKQYIEYLARGGLTIHLPIWVIMFVMLLQF